MKPAETPNARSVAGQPATGRYRPRRWLPYAGALLLVALIIAGLWPKPTPVETARAVVGPLRTTITEEGKTRIKHRYLVSAPVVDPTDRLVGRLTVDAVVDYIRESSAEKTLAEGGVEVISRKTGGTTLVSESAIIDALSKE